jgi:adenylosuccinate lyase
MPQKRNPWNSEHVKSLWKEFTPRVATFFMDQLSEHQRDLTNSASARFIPEFFAGLVAAASRMLRVLEGLEINRAAMLERLRHGAADLVLAEAAYVLLAGSGVDDAHERIRQLTLDRERAGGTLLEEAQRDAALWQKLDAAVQQRFGCPAAVLFAEPERYSGIAASKARRISARYAAEMASLEAGLAHADDASASGSP